MNTTINTVTLPGYHLGEQLYSGSRTVVYRGTRLVDDQAVVVKLLQQEYPTFHDLLQFRNQYAIAKNLDIPGIIRPYSLETYRNSYALVMEDLGSVSLRKYTSARTLDLAQVLEIAVQLADILHNLHASRVIHKDIKPANILIHPETKEIKLIDFSIASLLPKENQEIKNPNGLEGTLAYLAPEQTGRMNRGIDYRSDFYALGVTLFELLAGKLPFESDDPMELVHCHIAKQPPSLGNRQQATGNREEIPLVLENIVMKLMAKNAENRYQSALGLKYDLEICLHQLKETGKIEAFEIGTRDLCDRFIIPEKLYGRETEVKTLLDAFERVSQGTSEMMLVAGFSGIGKTAVINEVHKPITRQRGYFIKGKFDQFNRNIPFSAFVQAFRNLIGQLLAESDAQLHHWKTQILAALGENGQVLIEVIPELEQIIGQQPPAPELSGTAAQNRFNLLFGNFIKVFADREHPLVMFIDDLQWADSASLSLLKLLMQDNKYLLILGAYRDNEVFPAHPLMLTIDEIGKTGATFNTITLQPLDLADLNELVADTLSCDRPLAQPLTDLVFQKTKGNPFFATQFLKALYEEKQIRFDWEIRHWQCDIAQIKALALTDDVVEFMAWQLQKLPSETQNMLKLAACIGAQFDLNTLAIVSEESSENAAMALWKALQEGLIIPNTEIYKFFMEAGSVEVADTIANPIYRFLHDRVQQAAYELIPEYQKQATHLAIGRLLLQNTLETELEAKIFEIVNHWNAAIHLIADKSETEKLVKLNLTAGRKAKASFAYTSSLKYLDIGLELLPKDGWLHYYSLTLSLHAEAAEAAFLNTHFDRAQLSIDEMMRFAKNLLDKVKAYEIQIQSYIAQNKLLEALQVGQEILQLLGVIIPDSESSEIFQQEQEKIAALYAEKPIEGLIHLPNMDAPEQIAAMRILAKLWSSAFLAKPSLTPLIVFKQVELSLRYGHTSESTFACAVYASILINIIDDFETGYQFGQLALNLLESLGVRDNKNRTEVIVNNHIIPWKQHLRTTLTPLLKAYQTGLETGDFEFVSYAAIIYCYHSYFLGSELNALEQEMRAYTERLEQLKQFSALTQHKLHHQTVLNLLGKSEHPICLSGEVYDETAFSPVESTNRSCTFFWYFNKLILAYLFEARLEAIAESDGALLYLDSSVGLPHIPIFHFYDSLARLSVFLNVAKLEQERIIEKVSINQTKMKIWAIRAPMNHQHKYNLVEAEKHRVLGDIAEAIEYYDRAIAGAKENRYIQEEALANELAAKFYLAWGKEKVAAGYMQEAYYCYAKWGAKAKTDDLEQRYPNLLRPILQQAAPTLNPRETLTRLTNPTLSFHSTTKTSLSSSSRIDTALDFATIIKASQALSGTIQLDELLHQLTQIILQHSGGDRCALILHDNDGIWQVRAIATPEATELCAELLESNPHLPTKLIHYVKNAQEVVVINDLKTDLPVIGEYLHHQHPKSVLCLPILNQGNLIGIVYLENSSTSGAFASDRILILNFLCTQAAISLENARLYQQSQEYAQQLEQSQLQLVQSEKMSALGNLVAGVAHEINNPVGCIVGNVGAAQDYINDLLGIIDLYQEELPQPSAKIEEELKAIDLEYVREDLPKLIKAMNDGGHRIKSISQSLRTFSRADSDTKQKFNLHEGIDSTVLILRHRLKANEHRPAIEVVTDYGKLPEIACFPGQLNQVFMNILANAIDALDESNSERTFADIQANPNQITIRTSVESAGVKIAIADNGPGMPESVKTRIFDHLFTTKGVGKGTGLGLTIARQIVVEKHLGEILVNSEPGKGTEFILKLPIV